MPWELNLSPEAYGWWRGGGNNSADKTGIEGVVKYISTYTNNIFFKRILDEIGRFPHGNTDLLDAIMSCELFDNNVAELNKTPIRVAPPKEYYTVGRDSQGRTIPVWKTTA